MRFRFSGGNGIGGNLVFSAFGLFFAIMGCFFVKQEWNRLQEIKGMQDWNRTTCTVLTSNATDDGEDFRLELSYSYTVNGTAYTGTRYGKEDNLSAETIVEIKKIQNRWIEGSQHECYYNPEQPADAVFVLPTVKEGWRSVGFTLIFPAFGLLFAAIPWLFSSRKKKSSNAVGSTPKSPRAVPIIFGLIFAGVGLAMLKPLTIDPLMTTRDAQNWISVPAIVVSSKVKSSTDDDGTTYSVYIAYQFEIEGKEYYGDRYNLMSVSSSGYQSKADIVSQYPEGREFNVYVDPDNPEESVINRDVSLSLLFCLFPLPFIIMGLLVLIFGLRNKTPKLDEAQAREHIVHLQARSPRNKAIGVSAFTALWLGIVYFLTTTEAPLLFPIVFGFFGLILLGASIHSVLAVFNPLPVVEITPGDIHPGTNVAMRWRIDGRVDRIRTMSIKLKCLKITTETHRSGGKTSTSIVKTPLHETDLLQTDNQLEIAQGTLQCTIPVDRPPSRPGKKNGIEWQILFHGDITRWPDMKSELPFTVYPRD